jgi:hypothetical protein
LASKSLSAQGHDGFPRLCARPEILPPPWWAEDFVCQPEPAEEQGFVINEVLAGRQSLICGGSTAQKGGGFMRNKYEERNQVPQTELFLFDHYVYSL